MVHSSTVPIVIAVDFNASWYFDIKIKETLRIGMKRSKLMLKYNLKKFVFTQQICKHKS